MLNQDAAAQQPTRVNPTFAMNDLSPEQAMIVQQVLEEMPDASYQLEIMVRQWRNLCRFFVGDKVTINAVEHAYLSSAFMLVCLVYRCVAAIQDALGIRLLRHGQMETVRPH